MALRSSALPALFAAAWGSALGHQPVAIIGGGVSGLSAAFHLAKAGVRVDLYEANAYFGGRAAGYVNETGHWKEHSGRLYFNYYYNLFTMLKEVPISNGSAYDNLIELPSVVLCSSATPLVALTAGQALACGCSAPELQQFGAMLASYNHTAATTMSYRDYVTRFYEWSPQCLLTLEAFIGVLAAMRLDTRADVVFQYFLWGAGLPKVQGLLDGVPYNMNQPTSPAWIDPLVSHLESMGVRTHLGHRLVSLRREDGMVQSAEFRVGGQAKTVAADAFLLAVTEPAAQRVVPDLVGDLEGSVEWSQGFQFYLKQAELDVLARVPDPYGYSSAGTPVIGAVAVMGSPWQVAYWIYKPSERPPWSSTPPITSAADAVMTVSTSKFFTPGSHGKTAFESTPDELLGELLAQVGLGPDVVGPARFRELVQLGVVGLGTEYLGAGEADARLDSVKAPLQDSGHRWVNQGPIWVPQVSSPRVLTETAVGNLFLAGEYIDVENTALFPSMERATTSGILAAAAVGAYLDTLPDSITCGEAKRLYRQNQCCGGDPERELEGFRARRRRRLPASPAGARSAGDDAALLDSVRSALDAARVRGGAGEVAGLAAAIGGLLKSRGLNGGVAESYGK